MEESPQKAKKIRIWKPETLAKRQAAKEQRARDREIIKQENADPANKEWLKKVRAEMRGGSKPRKKRKKPSKMRRTRKARNLEGAKLKHASGKGRWVQKEVKRLEQLATSRGDGKKKRTFKKQMMKHLNQDIL